MTQPESNPITDFIETVQFVAKVVAAISVELVRQVVHQVVQTVIETVMAVVNFFVPRTTATVTGTINVNDAYWTPGVLTVSPDSKRLYLPLTQYGGVAVIDVDPNSATANTVLGTIGANNGIWSFADVAITPDGEKLFLVDSNEECVLTLDVSPGSSQGTYTSISFKYSPKFVAISGDGTRAYVPFPNADPKLAVIDTATDAITGTVPVGGFQPEGIGLSPDGTRAYVVTNSSIVSVIDTAALSTVATVGVGIDPTDLVVSPDGKRVYVANLNSNSVSVIDTATNTVVNAIGSSWPQALAISRDGRKLFVANWVTIDANNDSIYSIMLVDKETQIVTATIPVHGEVEDMVISPDGKRMYVTVSLRGSGETPVRILVIDI